MQDTEQVRNTEVRTAKTIKVQPLIDSTSKCAGKIAHSCLHLHSQLLLSPVNRCPLSFWQLPLSADVDLSEIARITDGFSGADLQAILGDAQLSAVHRFLDSTPPETRPSSQDAQVSPEISMEQLKAAALSARPSVPATERMRLNDIYDSFVGARSSKGSMLVSSVKCGRRHFCVG